MSLPWDVDANRVLGAAAALFRLPTLPAAQQAIGAIELLDAPDAFDALLQRMLHSTPDTARALQPSEDRQSGLRPVATDRANEPSPAVGPVRYDRPERGSEARLAPIATPEPAASETPLEASAVDRQRAASVRRMRLVTKPGELSSLLQAVASRSGVEPAASATPSAARRSESWSGFEHVEQPIVSQQGCRTAGPSAGGRHATGLLESSGVEAGLLGGGSPTPPASATLLASAPSAARWGADAVDTPRLSGERRRPPRGTDEPIAPGAARPSSVAAVAAPRPISSSAGASPASGDERAPAAAAHLRRPQPAMPVLAAHRASASSEASGDTEQGAAQTASAESRLPHQGAAVSGPATRGALVLDAAWEAALLDRLIDGWEERLREQAIRQVGFTGGRL